MRRNAYGFPAAGRPRPALLCAAAPALAHHSFTAAYNRNKPITFTGTVTKVEWMNPHIYYYVDVKDPAGKVTSYAVEGGTSNQLYRRGWRKDSLRVGDVITVSCFRLAKRQIGDRIMDHSCLENEKDIINLVPTIGAEGR